MTYFTWSIGAIIIYVIIILVVIAFYRRLKSIDHTLKDIKELIEEKDNKNEE